MIIYCLQSCIQHVFSDLKIMISQTSWNEKYKQWRDLNDEKKKFLLIRPFLAERHPLNSSLLSVSWFVSGENSSLVKYIFLNILQQIFPFVSVLSWTIKVSKQIRNCFVSLLLALWFVLANHMRNFQKSRVRHVRFPALDNYDSEVFWLLISSKLNKCVIIS